MRQAWGRFTESGFSRWLVVPLVVLNACLLIEDIIGEEGARWGPIGHPTLAIIALPILFAAGFGWTREMAAVARREHRLVDQATEQERREARRRAIASVVAAEESMRMVYQPIIDLERGGVVGYEALARFGDGRSPDLWFNDAHSVGIGVEMELAAIAKALDGFDGDRGYLAVNASPLTLLSGQLSDLMKRTSAPVVVEITEHAAIEDYGEVAAACEEVHRTGGRVAIDDVGSGNATLRNVLDLKPDIIKLDASLICHIDDDNARRGLAASLVGFAKSMGWQVVAEGIEREDELHACQEVGVSLGQGYLLGIPSERLVLHAA